jgi:putative ABC transport system substrate-binding protein
LWAGRPDAEQFGNVAVIYPSVREPFASIYRDFVIGIRQGYPGPVSEFAINGESVEDIASPEKGSDFNTYIALGNKSLKSVLATNTSRPVLAAMSSQEANLAIEAGILLKPGADVYLRRLMDIYPGVSGIHVVYNPARQAGLIDEAREFLKDKGIALNAVEAGNLREAALGYREVISAAEDGDAVWLFSDASVIDGSLLGLILDAAWKKRLAVFSSNPLFVRRGALFAIYPDNIGIGYRLGTMAMQIAVGKFDEGGIQYLKDVKIAFNERTSNHIGIKLSPDVEQDIEMMLPEL